MVEGLISIIIPVYNHSEVLPKSLGAIAAQVYQNVEVLLVDDGSAISVTEGDCTVLGAVKHEIIRQENRGAPAARNRGLQEAKGEFVIFWDADVGAPPTFLEKLVSALRRHKDASYAYTDQHFGFKIMPAMPFDADCLRKKNYIHSTALIRAKDVIRWDESLKRFQDWDVWLSLLAKHKIGVYVPGTFFLVTPRKGGISTWLPRFAYHVPFSWLPGIRRKVAAYYKAKEIIVQKHRLREQL